MLAQCVQGNHLETSAEMWNIKDGAFCKNRSR